MEIKHIWRTIIHKTRSNKILGIAGILVTIFLWNTMTIGKGNNEIEFAEEQTEHENRLNTEHRDNRMAINEGERQRNFVREKEVKIDIRGINSKLETINKLNSNSEGKSQLYSLTNIDPDVEKGERQQALVGAAFNVLDNFVDTNSSDTYKGLKSLFQMWNPKSSKVIIIH